MTPDSVATAKLIHATQRVCDQTTFIAAGIERAAGSATTARKIRAPAVVAVAAKCTARTITNGPFTPSPSQSIGFALRFYWPT